MTSEKRGYLFVCVDNSGYPASLILHKAYKSIPDPTAAGRGLIRIIDESGDDYLYPTNRFVSKSNFKQKGKLS